MKIPSQFRDAILIGDRPQARTVEVCRSFAYKLNLANYGGKQYESCDFFASRKLECAAGSADMVSESIFEECVAEVRASVAKVINEMQRKNSRRSEVA